MEKWEPFVGVHILSRDVIQAARKPVISLTDVPRADHLSADNINQAPRFANYMT